MVLQIRNFTVPAKFFEYNDTDLSHLTDIISINELFFVNIFILSNQDQLE